MYYLYIDEQQRGPFTIEQLAELGITPETEVWTEGMTDWKQAGDVPQLTTLLQRLQYERHEANTRQAATPPTHHSQAIPPAWDGAAQQQSNQSSTPKRGRTGAKWLTGLLIILILLGVLVVTCPNRETHRQAIMGSTRTWVSDKVEERGMGDIFGELVKWVSGKGADIAIDQMLIVDNHFIYSTGKFVVGDEPKTVSLGILGHVFTFGKEDIDKVIRQAMGMEEPQQPSVRITPTPEVEPDEPLNTPDDTLGSVTPREDEPYDPAQALVDSLARKAKEQAIKVAKEWAKKQIDNL